MPRKQYSDGQEIDFADFNAESALLEKELYERVILQMLQRQENAFFGDSFKVNFVGPAAVTVVGGAGFQTDGTQVDPEPTKRLLWLPSASPQSLAAADTVHDRIDILCVRADRANILTESRRFKDAVTSVISNQNTVTETDWLATIQVVTGTPGVSPAVPATPSGFLKIAQVYVVAVTGLADQSGITDSRVYLPVGSKLQIPSTGFNRLPVGGGGVVLLDALLTALDAYLVAGYQNYTDFDDLVSDPSAPASSRQRFYIKGGVAFLQDSSSTITPLGSGGGGGGGGANWNGDGGVAPLADNENGEKVWLYERASAGSQKLTLFVKVPQGYLSGRQIIMYLAQYSPSSANTQLLTSSAGLIRKNLDSVVSPAATRTSTNTALTNTVANQYRQSSLDLTDSLGKIGGFNVSPGDLLKVDLLRGTDTDTADIRFVPSGTEVKFS